MNLPQLYAHKEFHHVTEEEAEAVWRAARRPVFRLFIKVLWYTGLRINEVLALKASDLEYFNNKYTLRITRLKKRSKKTERLPVKYDLGTNMSDYLQTSGAKGRDLIFPGHENTYRYQVKRCAKEAGLPDWKAVHPHSFRHGFVYNKVKNNVHPFVLRELIGHSSLTNTMYYYQPTEDDLRRALEE